MLQTLRRVDVFSPQSSGSPKKVSLGGPCRKSAGIGTPSIVDSGDGAMWVSLKHSMNIFTMRVKSLGFSWIRRWCGQTLVQPVPRKKGGQDAACLGRSRGGFTTKLNLSLSDAWVPLRLIFTPGHRNDITQASALIQGYTYKSVIVDKVSYDSDAFREEIVSAGGVAVIPPHRCQFKGRRVF